jgi:hypothetical protein
VHRAAGSIATSPLRTRWVTGVQANSQTTAIRPCPTHVYVDSAARSYPATDPPPASAAAKKIDTRITPKTVFVNAPARVARR